MDKVLYETVIRKELRKVASNSIVEMREQILAPIDLYFEEVMI